MSGFFSSAVLPMTSDDVRESSIYWQLLDVLPTNPSHRDKDKDNDNDNDNHREASDDQFVVQYILDHGICELTTDVVSAVQLCYQKTKTRREESRQSHEDTADERKEACRLRLTTAFASENFLESDLVRDLVNVFEEEDAQGENLVSCATQYMLDATQNEDEAMVRTCLDQLRTLKENASANGVANVFTHMNKKGVSAWSKVQRLKGERLQSMESIFTP